MLLRRNPSVAQVRDGMTHYSYALKSKKTSSENSFIPENILVGLEKAQAFLRVALNTLENLLFLRHKKAA